MSLSEDLLLKTASFLRRPFFKLWNELQNTEEAFLPLQTKLEIILKKLGSSERTAPRLPTGCQFISILHPDYPKAFFELPQPPLGFFLMGKIENLRRAGVVGSRKPLAYSLRLTRELTALWARKGYSIVSGGAIGIDGEAHRTCLEAGGHTIVVLGGGLGHWHPRSHGPLFREVIRRGGALLSEYPPDFEPRTYTFPERNRLIAALSDVLFLAQAHAKSGSLSTARAALDMGKEIYVLRPVPGDEHFYGSQELLDSGAKSLIDARELDYEMAG